MKLFKGRHGAGGIGRKIAKTWNSQVKKPRHQKPSKDQQNVVGVVPPPPEPRYIGS